MKLISIETDYFRNLKKNKITFSENTNIIYGDNAQGKTNLIEAIWLFCGAKSFRGSRETELVTFEKETASLRIFFKDNQREQKAQLFLGEKRKLFLNDVPYNNSNELVGKFFCVVFSPIHLSLIKDGPSKRRRFIDIAIAQIKPGYLSYLNNYNKIIDQRNALLKELKKSRGLIDTIDLWDKQLAKVGTIISIIRNDYITKISAVSKKIYLGISQKKETLTIDYLSTIYKEKKLPITYSKELVDVYYNQLKEHLENDIKTGVTNYGIHRDDLNIEINGVSAKTYGSQGQQRSCVLSLKLAEANLLKIVTEETPIILLDDVMSELDVLRQDYILNKIKEFQVFITCCDPSNLLRLTKGDVFEVTDGLVTLKEKGVI